MPERYGTSDGSLTIVTFVDGSQAFVISGKVSSGNPFEVSHAADAGAYAGGGVDRRRTHVAVYEYNGSDTLVERMSAGADNVYTGKDANTQLLLSVIKKSLGKSVGKEDFIAS